MNTPITFDEFCDALHDSFGVYFDSTVLYALWTPDEEEEPTMKMLDDDRDTILEFTATSHTYAATEQELTATSGAGKVVLVLLISVAPGKVLPNLLRVQIPGTSILLSYGPHRTCTLTSSDLKVDPGDTEFNSAVDGLEALVLALACEGMDMQTPEMGRAITTAVESMANNI